MSDRVVNPVVPIRPGDLLQEQGTFLVTAGPSCAGGDRLIETPYGFVWGDVAVFRTWEHRGSRVVSLASPRAVCEVRFTPTGLVRLATRRATPGDRELVETMVKEGFQL